MSKRNDELIGIIAVLFVVTIPFMLLKGIFDFIVKNKEEQKRKEFLQQLDEELIDNVQEHYSVLSNKREMLCYTDDYGNYIDTEWKKELKYFIEKVFQSSGVCENLDVEEEYLEHWYTKIESYMEDLKFEDGYERNTLANKDLLITDSYKNGYEFEAVCKQLLERLHYTARTTAKSGDQGVDVLAKKGGKEIAIQCKLYSQPVGNKAVQEVASGKAYYKSDYAVVITNNTFTKSARQLAKNCNVILLNINDINKLDEILGFPSTPLDLESPEYVIDERIPIREGVIGEKLYRAAISVIFAEGKATTNLIQRKLNITYSKAAETINRLENERIISHPDKNGQRKILKTFENIIDDIKKGIKQKEEERIRNDLLKKMKECLFNLFFFSIFILCSFLTIIFGVEKSLFSVVWLAASMLLLLKLNERNFFVTLYSFIIKSIKRFR